MRGMMTVLARGLRKDEGGAALVEFALVAPVFLALLIAILQLGVLGMMSANFNGAMESVARRIRTGQADKPADAAAFRNLLCAKMVDTAANCQARMKIAVVPVNGNFGAAKALAGGQDPNNLTATQAYATGNPEQIMLVTATYSWPLALPFVGNAYIQDGAWNVLIVSRLAFRNEPFE